MLLRISLPSTEQQRFRHYNPSHHATTEAVRYMWIPRQLGVGLGCTDAYNIRVRVYTGVHTCPR